MSDWQETIGVSFIRPTLEMAQSSGSVKLTFCFQYSNSRDPGATWTTTTVTVTENTDNPKFSGWIDMSAWAGLYVRFGVRAEQESGTAMQMAVAILRVDMK